MIRSLARIRDHYHCFGYCSIGTGLLARVSISMYMQKIANEFETFFILRCAILNSMALPRIYVGRTFPVVIFVIHRKVGRHIFYLI